MMIQVFLRENKMSFLWIFFLFLNCSEKKGVNWEKEPNRHKCIEIVNEKLDSIIFSATEKLNKGIINYNDTLYWKPKTLSVYIMQDPSEKDIIKVELLSILPRYKLIEDTNITKVNDFYISLYIFDLFEQKSDMFFKRNLNVLCINPPKEVINLKTDIPILHECFEFDNNGKFLGVCDSVK